MNTTTPTHLKKKKYSEWDHKWLIFMSQTYYTNLTFLWYILPTVSNIVLHLLILVCMAHKKKSHFFTLFPQSHYLCTRSHTHTPKKAAQPEGKNPSKSSICHKYTWCTELLPSAEEKTKILTTNLILKGYRRSHKTDWHDISREDGKSPVLHATGRLLLT